MRHLLSLLRRFHRDDSGAFAIIFAVLAIVLVAMSGAVVDFTSMQQARTRAQVALDAAALALQPRIYDTAVATIGTEAQNLLLNRLADASTTWADCTKNGNKAPCANLSTPVIDTVNGQLSLTATVKVPMNFVSLVGVQTLTAQILSVATRKKLALEVAMVLDNSGSMSTNMTGGHTRMYNLQASANCAANILFYGVTTCAASTAGKTLNTATKMAVVPFTSAVNVGTSHANDTWIDRTGNSNISDNNFDTDDNSATAFNGPVDRIGLFSKLSYGGTALSWGGCVEARYNNGSSKQYDTDDTIPDPAQSDTLFTPYFAPDEPGAPNTAGSTVTAGTDKFYNSYISDTGVGTGSANTCNKTGTCSETATAPVTYNAVTVITTTSYTTTVTNNKGKVTAGPTTTNSAVSVGPTNGSGTAGSSTITGATITIAGGATRTATGVCTCSGSGATGTSNGSATTSGAVSKSTVAGTTPKDPTPTVDSKGNTTTIHYTGVSIETDTQLMKYTATTSYLCTGAYYSPWSVNTQASGGLSNKVMQERLCKYTGAVLSNAVNQGNVYGPNGDCPFNPITPLTGTPATVTTAVNAMSPQGATNIAEGAAWGFRVLSPTAPFTEGAAYGQATSKVMIVMTDGENTRYPDSYMNDAQYYSPYGYPTNTNGRLGTATTDAHTLEQRVNDRLSAICTNAKTAGITVYTIGLDTSATDYPSENTTLLTNCASESDYAFFPNTASDLQAAFVAIANQLAALRLAK